MKYLHIISLKNKMVLYHKNLVNSFQLNCSFVFKINYASCLVTAMGCMQYWFVIIWQLVVGDLEFHDWTKFTLLEMTVWVYSYITNI